MIFSRHSVCQSLKHIESRPTKKWNFSQTRVYNSWVNIRNIAHVREQEVASSRLIHSMICGSPLQTSISHCLKKVRPRYWRESRSGFTLLHAALNFVVDRVQVGTVWRTRSRSDEVGVLRCSSWMVSQACMAGGALSCWKTNVYSLQQTRLQSRTWF